MDADQEATLRRITGAIVHLTDKRDRAGQSGGEFTEDDEAVLTALGAAAGIATENARLYEAARRDQRWIAASAEVTTALLSGTEPADVLDRITRTTRELSGADLAVLALPEDGRTTDGSPMMTYAYAAGDGAAAARGLMFPGGHSLSGLVLAHGEHVTSADFAHDERAASIARDVLGHIGPAVFFPLGAPGAARGTLMIGRRHGAAPFPASEVALAAGFAAQAGVALELAATRAEAMRLSLYADRDRIARDLHDLVIQRLYATGMSLEGTVPLIAAPAAAARVSGAVDAMDETIKEIRGTIFALQTRAADHPDLRAEILALAEEMTPMLGFAPTLRLGAALASEAGADAGAQALAALREALSNAARHAGASRVEVAVDVTAGVLSVLVTDDGAGIAADIRRSGLDNLAARAAQLGGELRLGPASPGAGTRLEWRVPAG